MNVQFSKKLGRYMNGMKKVVKKDGNGKLFVSEEIGDCPDYFRREQAPDYSVECAKRLDSMGPGTLLARFV